MPAAVAAPWQSCPDHPLVGMETAAPGPSHAMPLPETPSETFITSATVILEAGTRRVLQVSAGFSYTWDASRPVGSRVDAASITIDGVAINLDRTYRVTVNSFLADGGGGFDVLTEGAQRTGGEIDLDALVAYFAGVDAVSPRSAGPHHPRELIRTQSSDRANTGEFLRDLPCLLTVSPVLARYGVVCRSNRSGSIVAEPAKPCFAAA